MGYEYTIVEVEFTPGVWTEVTGRLDGTYEIAGGDTPEASADPGGLALPLRNHDQEMTPGNVLGAHHPIEPGIRCRVRDVIDGQSISLYTGYLQFPEAENWTASTAEAPRDQTIIWPFVDLVSFVDDSRTLAAALTEHIVHNGRGDLEALWPLTNERAPLLGVGPVTTPMTTTRSSNGSGQPPLALPIPQGGNAPPAAEANALRCTRLYDAFTGSEAYNRVLAPDTFLPAIATGETVTVVFWFSHQEAAAALFQQIAAFQIIGSSNINIELLRDSATGVWTLSASGAQTATISVGSPGLDALLPIAIRYCPSPAAMEIWVGSVRLTTTPAGAAPTGMSLDGPDFGFQLGEYDLSNVQVYIGQTWGYTDYLTQIEQAYAPLERQLTGERIRTALLYAGIDVPMHRIDPGVAVMTSVQMAGRKAPDLIGDAVETEQGEYYADGDGLPVFADRLRLYNV